MKTHTENSSETKKEAVSKEETKNSKTANQPFQFVDNRPETIAQLKMKEMLKNSQQTMQMKNEQERPNVNTTATDELSKKEIAPFQLKEDPTGDAPPNGGSSDPNKTGLPDNLKTGMESLSGMPLDDVNVHYNSEKPAQLQALAYAQGTDIHLGPGQEEHLPHELGHVVQQKKGNVKPTMQMMGKSEGVPVNDDPQLEREADLMGGEALQMKANEKESNPASDKLKQGMSALSSGKGPVQREEDPYADPYAEEECDPNAEPIAEEECLETDPTAAEQLPVPDPNAEPIAEEEYPVSDPTAEVLPTEDTAAQNDVENESSEEKSLLAELANNTKVTYTYNFNLAIPVEGSEKFIIGGFIKFDLGQMSIIGSEINISYNLKAFEGNETSPDFKPLDIKLTNTGSGYDLGYLGFSLGDFAAKVNKGELSASYSKGAFGLGVSYSTEKVTITSSMDVIAALFGAKAIEDKVKEWTESLGEGINATVTAQLPFEASLVIPLKKPLSLQMDKVSFKPNFGIKMDALGAVGFDAGASASIESDYATGEPGDEFSTTTGKTEAHIKVIILGQEFGPESETETTQKGTLWESVEMQKKLLALCAEKAYLSVHDKQIGNDSADKSTLVNDFESSLQTNWKEGVRVIMAEKGVNIDAVRAVNLDIYYVNANVCYVQNESDIINKVIAANNKAKIVHEAIVFNGLGDLSGQYQAKSGGWNTVITLKKEGNVITGVYENGQFSGEISGQIIKGDWMQDNGNGGYGEFVLQVQENGKRLSGNWTDENNESMTWELTKL